MSKHVSLALCFKDLEKGPHQTSVLLVCEQTDNKYDAKDAWRWQLPGGKCCSKKFINTNCCAETPEQTVLRECKEETGYDIVLKKLFLQEELSNPESREKYMRHVFLIEISGGEMKTKNTPSGNKTPQWFKLSAVPRNLFFSHQEIIKKFFVQKGTKPLPA